MTSSSIPDKIAPLVSAVRDRFSGVLGLAAANLATGEEIAVEADRTFPTASAFKIPVMVEVFRQERAGHLRLDERLELRPSDLVRGSGVLRDLMPGLTPTIYDLAMLMIVVSDNTATNMLIDRVGGIEPINRTMQERLGLSSIVVHNRIDFDLIGDDNRRIAEASPRDLMRLCALIAREELIDAEASRQMLAIMRRQHYLDQVPRYIEYNPYGPEFNLPQPVWFANKTGGLPGMRSDAGVISLPGDVRIAYCTMTEHSADTGFTFENEAEITNGILGRILVEYWWPGDWAAAGVGRSSPYVDAVLGSAGAVRA
ncbi:MAG: beta-lactamase class [Thermomicrobiales bacterium]|jgi:beta-lactamase class A|nr:beta-lactamase class [Thermomicrobiales bacterium]